MSIGLPDIEFEYWYASEDIGNECGKYIIRNGQILSQDIPIGGSREAFELSFELLPDMKDCFKLVDGKYQDIDD